MVKTPSGFKLLIGGGSSLKFGKTGSAIRSVHLFDPRTQTWSGAAALPTPLLDMASVQYSEEKVLFIGGSTSEKGTEYNDKIYEYNGLTNKWRTWPKSLGAGRRGAAVIVIGGEGA